jgi:dihydrofolate synthase/folylpolyglutamate synthase
LTTSLGDALEWLDRHVNLEAIVAGRSQRKPSLERIRALVGAMGDPQASYPVLHVTGTNGKGSTVRMATALLAADGLSVGTYTSPHLERLNERIAWNGDPIPDDALAEVLSALRDLEPFAASLAATSLPATSLSGGGAGLQGLSWFELMTAAAYRWFSDVAVEAAVVEVGLGGRFDATNVADGAVAAVTNVDLDHTELLGPTREDVAREKAGIVKKGSVVVLGETDPALAAIFEAEAALVGAGEIWRRDRDFGCEANRLAHGGRLLDLRTPAAAYDEVYLPMAGAHQGDNAAVAVAAVEAFFGVPLSEEVVHEAFRNVTVPGRMEVVGRRPLVVLDGAHNAAGARVAGETLAEDFAGVGRIVVVMGCLRGRDPADMLQGLRDSRVVRVVACPAPSARGMGAEEVAGAARSAGLEAEAAPSVAEGLEAAIALAGPEDLVLVTGSLYVVGAARSLLRR